jgi:hypothetical protein
MHNEPPRPDYGKDQDEGNCYDPWPTTSLHVVVVRMTSHISRLTSHKAPEPNERTTPDIG